MKKESHGEYNRENVIFKAALDTGILDRIGANLDMIPVWNRQESGKSQLDVVLYGLRLGKAEWSPPRGVIRDAASSPTLLWLPTDDGVGKLPTSRQDGLPPRWQPHPHIGEDEWWEARERIIGYCERTGELFQQQSSDLSVQDVALLRQTSMDYELLLPPELLALCRELYPEFFDWLAGWGGESR